VQGGLYNALMRALQQLGLADAFGEAHPAAGAQRHLPAGAGADGRLLRGKRAVLVLEEGQPEYIEQDIATAAPPDMQTPLHGKDLLPAAGEYTWR
jgi:indolepyruvate ferredoxin oxidoreductase alpha subunit